MNTPIVEGKLRISDPLDCGTYAEAEHLQDKTDTPRGAFAQRLREGG